MEREIEDIKKLEAVLKEERSHNNLQEDFEDLLNYNVSDEDEQLEGYESDSSLDLENITEDKLRVTESKCLDVGFLNFSKGLSSIKRFLSAEEIRVINSCKDGRLKQLLLLNRAKSVHLRSALYKLCVSYKQVRERTVQANEEAKVKADKELRTKRGLICKIGYPYFKVKHRFSCAPNEDAVRKQASGDICLAYLTKRRRWTVGDQVLLKRSVCYQYTTGRIRQTERRLIELTKSKANAERENEIKDCEAIVLTLKDSDRTHVPPLNGDVEIDWREISQYDLSGRHTAQACKAMWNMYLHPSINKSKWTESEDNKLKELAEKYNHQDWDTIAKELDNNRTAFTVCVHFRSSLLDICHKGKFGPEEDERLLQVVDMCRVGSYIPWSKVAQHFTNRERNQLYNRYTVNLKETYQKKGAFSEEEDVLLMILVRKFGPKFNTICNYVPYRNRMQVSHRYNNYLNYEVVKNAGWSLSDDTKIIAHVEENGAKKWQDLVDQIPNRNASQFRHRYMYIKRWLSSNEGKGIEDLPRKSEQKPKQNVAFLKEMADAFAESAIPSLAEIKEKIKNKTHKRGRKSAARYVHQAVDDELLQYFQSSHKFRTAKQITISNMSSVCTTIKSILAVLKVTLVVPEKSSLKGILTLDDLDREILLNLFQNVYSQYSHSTTDDWSTKEIRIEFKLNSEVSLLPPNLNTLVGMRGMLLKYNGFKAKLTKVANTASFSEAKTAISDNLKLKLNEYDGTMQKLIAMDHENFKLRLKAFFKWPAVMSLVEPERNLLVLTTNRVSKPVLPRKVGRPKKDTSKIDLMNKRRLMKRSALLSASNQQTGKCERVHEDVNVTESESTQCNVRQQMSDEPDGNDVEQENPRKKIRTEIAISDELQEDIRKLDEVLLNEMKKASDLLNL